MRLTSTAPSGLARKTLGAGALWFFAVSASAPMTVLAGGVVATYAATGVVGVPLSFLVLGVALGLFSFGYVAMSRYVSNAGAFYAYLAHGLGQFWGVVAVPVALVGYNAIQISLYGLIGATMSGLLGGVWWVWALLSWAAVALLGVLNIRINASVLAIVLITEIVVIVMIDVVSFLSPAEGVDITPLEPASLLVPGIGGVFALGIAAFIGYESAPVYREEARSHSAVTRGTFGALVFLALFYALSAWALAVAVGPKAVVDTARDPESGIPFSILGEYTGPSIVGVATTLLITSVFAALLSFHSAVARYVFALSRERVLPARLAYVGRGSGAGAPIGGSALQSAIALAVILAFVLADADPVLTLFTWLSSLAALAIMLLMVGTSIGVIRFFRHGGGTNESAWQRLGAPALGAVAMGAILITTVVNIGSLLGTAPGSPVALILPGLLAAAVVAGVLWAVTLRAARPDVFQSVGRGQPKPLEVIDQRLSDLSL